jgi:hypothetical protein
MEYKG